KSAGLGPAWSEFSQVLIITSDMATGLSRFESFAEKLVEGAFERMGGHRLEPVEIARRLGRSMEDNQTIGAGKIFVPNVYHVGLHPDTFQQFVSFKEPLEDELASYLVDKADKQGFEFIGRPHVTITVEPRISRGRLTISAQLAGGGTGPTGSIDATQAIRTDDIRSAATAEDHPHGEPLQLVIGQRILPLSQPPISIGRSLDNDVIIQSASVSRRHAQILFRHSRWLLRDLHSTHGTQVNGRAIEECVLRAGDTITVGDVTAHVQAIAGAASQADAEETR
ncbi:MAG: FhaA domain-containing protein, partial [Anaerolineae bacterium]